MSLHLHMSHFDACMKTEVDLISTSPGISLRRPGCLLQIHPVVMNGGLIRLGENELAIGREESSGIPLADKSVSRNHAAICHVKADAYVRDLGSTNGTWVNDTRIGSQPYRLVAGDRIRFGTHVFKYLSANDIETQYHAAAYAMMTRDGATGTLNKQSLLENFDREICRAMRRKRSLSLILLDVDHFKMVNDRYGHLAGDQVLREMCGRISDQITDEVLLARFGGEEFAMLLPEETSVTAAALAERFRRAVEQNEFDTCGGVVRVTASFGVAEMEEVIHTIDSEQDAETFRASLRREMLEHCDQRLYRAKSLGRNQVVSS